MLMSLDNDPRSRGRQPGKYLNRWTRSWWLVAIRIASLGLSKDVLELLCDITIP